jgi:DNA-binding SARP family transcriptional activator
MTVLCGLADAHFALDAGDEQRGVEALRAALTLARMRGYVTFARWRPSALARLFAVALAHDIEPEYVRALIKRRALAPPPEIGALDAWPLPVKIYSLGRFAVLVDERALKFTSKAQKKPLELLKALIALGGNQVREEKVMDLLWPDSEAQDHALKSAIHRLRKLIGEAALERQEGRLTLNRAYCWVDAVAVETALAKLDDACRRRDMARVSSISSGVLRLYRGDLLASEPDSGWSIAARERLRGRVLRNVENAARLLEQSKHYQQAIDCYQNALEIDAAAEVFYRGLIRTYLAINRRADALTAYERCRRVLAAQLRIAPSAATEQLVAAPRARSESDL